MDVERLTEEVNAALERVQDELDRGISDARKDVVALSREKSATEAAINDLEQQRKSAESDLNSVLGSLRKAMELAGIEHEIELARKALQEVKNETATLTTGIAALKKEHEAARHQVNAINNEVTRLGGVRAQHEGVIADLKRLVKSFS